MIVEDICNRYMDQERVVFLFVRIPHFRNMLCKFTIAKDVKLVMPSCICKAFDYSTRSSMAYPEALDIDITLEGLWDEI